MRRRWIVLPMMMVLIFALPQFLGGRMRVDSGLYSGVSVHAYEHGTWWTLMAGDQPYFRKPPLAFWIHGAAFELLGRDLWVMRLPNVLAALACAAMTAAIGRRLGGWRVGMLAGIIFAGTIPVFRYLERFILDYWHTLCILTAVWLVVGAAQRGRGGRIILAGLCIGVAMMFKPMTAGLSLPILAAWLAATGRARLVIWIVPACVAALAVAAPWYVCMIALHGEAFVNEYFGRQMIGRATGASIGTGFVHEPWYWYLEHLGREYWPWMLPLALGLIHAWRFGFGPLRRAAGLRQLFSLCIIWSVAWLLIISISTDKHDRYFMQALPMLGMIAATWLAYWSPTRFWRVLDRGLTVGIPVAVVLAMVIAALPIDVDKPESPEWTSLYEYMLNHSDERFVMGTIPYRDGGRIYFYTDIWPHNNIDAHGRPITPLPGDLVIHRRDELPEPPPSETVVFDQGELIVVRTGN